MATRPSSLLLLAALLVGWLGPGPAAPAAAARPAQAPGAGLAGRLNPDGTLRLAGGFSGALDLSGWNVQLDPERGPVFAAAGNLAPQTGRRSVDKAPAGVAAPGQWANVGSGGRPLTGLVHAIAITGTSVYVGGDFHDANSLGSSADKLVKWDGSHWSVLDPSTHINSLGTINALAVSGSDLYVGGLFVVVNAQGANLNTLQNVAKWNGSNWSALGGNGAGGPSLTGAVRALAVSGSNVYVGGDFMDVNNKGTLLPTADFVARWDGSDWFALSGNGAGDGSLSDSVYALAVIGSAVYVGGSFVDVNNNGAVLLPADYLARWDGSHWFAVGNNGAGGASLNGPVAALAVSGLDLYVGGDFTNVQNGIFSLDAADYLARWNGSWHAVGAGSGSGGSLNGAVSALAVIGADLYVGGDFTDVQDGNTALPTADWVARWNGSHWLPLGFDGLGDGAIKTGPIAALAGDAAGNLYVGGSFQSINNGGTVLGNAAEIAMWTGTQWAALAGQPEGVLDFGNNTVNTLAVNGSEVYIGGTFYEARDGSNLLTAADYVAKWDGAHWSALGSNGAGNGALNGIVDAIAISGPDVYVGGDFTSVNDSGSPVTGAAYIARWDGTHWHALGNAALNGDVFALAVSGSNLYVGGAFTNVSDNGTPLPAADHIAKWDGSHWTALGSGQAGNGSISAVVDAIAVSGPVVYAGGEFSDVNNHGVSLLAADYIAKWDNNNWSALGSGVAGNGALNQPVRAIALSGSNVYAGGDFTNAGNNGAPLPAADYIAKWDGNNWSALGSGAAGDGALNQPVLALAVSGGSIYAGGSFTNASNNGSPVGAADFVARWDGSHWSALGGNGAGDGSLNKDVDALAMGGSDLFVGGVFYDVNNNGLVLPAADLVAAFGIGARLYLPLVRR